VYTFGSPGIANFPYKKSRDHKMANQEEELKAYLEGHSMSELIKDMTTGLLSDKPEEPVTHLVKHLFTAYPEKAASANVPKGGGAVVQASSSLAALMSAEVDTDASEEDDDADAPEYIPPKVMSKKGRKTAVSAESMDPAKMKEQMKNLVVIEKDEVVKAKLLEVVAKSALLKMLDQEQKDKIVNAFSGKFGGFIEGGAISLFLSFL
jgi:hypothetical protein